MTLSEFRALDEIEKQAAIWQGVHVGTRYDEHHSILLFQVDSFYVEVFYHRELSIIRRYRPFARTEPLYPYLRQIDISGLNQ